MPVQNLMGGSSRVSYSGGGFSGSTLKPVKRQTAAIGVPQRAATTAQPAGQAAPIASMGVPSAPTSIDFGPEPGGPAAPQLSPYQVNEQAPPELVAARQRAEKYMGELESGTGYAMDVMQGGMQAQIDADVKRARESAAAQGMPFDEAGFRADAMAKMQSGLAQEKLGRERLRGEMMGGLQGVIEGGEKGRLARSEFELGRQRAHTGDVLQRYGTEAGVFGTRAGMYGTRVSAATSKYQTDVASADRARDALMGFLQSAFSFSA